MLVAVHVLHGEVALQTRIAFVHALIHTINDELSVEGSLPDTYLVHVAREAVLLSEARQFGSYRDKDRCDAGYGALGQHLQGIAVNVSDCAGAPAHVQCHVVPVAVQIVLVAQGGAAVRHLQCQFAVVEAYDGLAARGVVGRHQCSVGIAGLRAAEPHLVGKVVEARCGERRDVNLQRTALLAV